jgi:hypothetical protein
VNCPDNSLLEETAMFVQRHSHLVLPGFLSCREAVVWEVCMKPIKDKIYLIVSIIYIAVTVGINIYGYFHLPDQMATQFGITGEQVNRMPKEIYLVFSFAAVFILALFTITKGQQKLKYLIVNALIVIMNIVMIAMQL